MEPEEITSIVIPLREYDELLERALRAEMLLSQNPEGAELLKMYKPAPVAQLANDEARAIELEALDTYGAPAQILMVYEEMGELMKELSKNQRGKDNNLQIAEEIADVRIMLEQMALLFGIERDCERFRYAKLMRLKDRLSHAEHSD